MEYLRGIQEYLDSQGVRFLEGEEAIKFYKANFPEEFELASNEGSMGNQEEFYSRMAECYDMFQRHNRGEEGKVGAVEKHMMFLREYSEGKGLVIDSGCGTGLDICYLAGEFPEQEFVGYDFIPRMVEITGERAEEMGLRNVEVHVAEHREAPGIIGRQGDLVYASSVCSGGEDRVLGFLFGIKDLTKLGGIFINTGDRRYAMNATLKQMAHELGFRSEEDVGLSARECAFVFRKVEEVEI